MIVMPNLVNDPVKMGQRPSMIAAFSSLLAVGHIEDRRAQSLSVTVVGLMCTHLSYLSSLTRVHAFLFSR
jgi:hypothetical protein